MDSYKLDPTDLKILDLLQTDGLMSYRELSKHTHKTHNPLVKRVNRLRELGYIKSTIAVIDIAKIKNLFTAFSMVTLNNHSDMTLNDFQTQIMQMPEVAECHHISGEYDFMVKLVMEDIHCYTDFLRKRIASLPYVASVRSFPALAETKRELTYRL
ncbi:Lrp/AsnC family transcriptional regulator [Pedobacter sp. UC225_61]|uniref:Lrp/AsnC family transcriptional regulator n=1 Tax=Pedobacter sp. UC225_61 TaxID=3374623 RepID=UPI0037B5353E